jgi:rhodanese-related sulfurtransferase
MKTSLVLVAAAGMLALLIAAAPARAQQEDLSAVDPTIAESPAPPPQTVTPQAVLKLMQDKDSSITLVDTQPVDGYADGHLPGAMSYPWAMRIAKFPIPLPRNKTLVFYGSCPNDTSDLIKQLAEFGYFNIKVMDGGWYKWVDLKYPAEGNGKYAQAHPASAPAPAEQPASQALPQSSAPQPGVAQNAR